MATVTVHDALRLALPVGSSVAAGSAGLQRPVSWPAVARAVAPLFSDLRGNEFALVSVRVLRESDPPLALHTLIERLAAVPIAALAVVGRVDDTAVSAADRLRIPLIQLPDDSDIRAVDRELQRLVSDFDAQTDRRAAQLALELGELALTEAGIPAMIDMLAARTGRAVTLYSAKGEVFCTDTQRDPRTTVPDYTPTIGMTTHLGVDFACEPLRAGDRLLGYIVFIGPALTAADTATLKRTTMALALEYTKSQAVHAVEARFRGNFVEHVLSGQLSNPLTIQQRAREFGYDLRHGQRATLCAAEGDARRALQRQFGVLVDGLTQNIPWIEHHNGILCFVPDGVAAAHAPALTATISAQLRTTIPTVRILQGRIVYRIDEWKRSVAEAEQLLRLPDAGQHTTTTYESIGAYQLLLPVADRDDTRRFYHTHLGALLAYDQEQNAELMHTLVVYFDCSGNLARTAETLHVHRNTLLYRLTRISQILTIDLEDPETRLSLWLSVKLHRLFTTTHTE